MSNYKLAPWGYMVDSAQNVTDLLSVEEFLNFTNKKYNGNDTRIVPNIASASASVRNYCGWHVAPALNCAMNYNVRDLRDAFVGGDLLIQLPATFVTSVSKVTIDGEEIEANRVDLSPSGLVRIFDTGVLDKRSRILIEFTSGFDEVPAIKEIVANGVMHALANTYGVASEAAGGVSVSYSANWSGKGSTALADEARETLEAYKVKGVY